MDLSDSPRGRASDTNPAGATPASAFSDVLPLLEVPIGIGPGPHFNETLRIPRGTPANDVRQLLNEFNVAREQFCLRLFQDREIRFLRYDLSADTNGDKPATRWEGFALFSESSLDEWTDVSQSGPNTIRSARDLVVTGICILSEKLLQTLLDNQISSGELDAPWILNISLSASHDALREVYDVRDDLDAPLSSDS